MWSKSELSQQLRALTPSMPQQNKAQRAATPVSDRFELRIVRVSRLGAIVKITCFVTSVMTRDIVWDFGPKFNFNIFS